MAIPITYVNINITLYFVVIDECKDINPSTPSPPPCLLPSFCQTLCVLMNMERGFCSVSSCAPLLASKSSCCILNLMKEQKRPPYFDGVQLRTN